MPNGIDPTDDDPTMGQGGPPPPDPQGGAGGPPQGTGGPGPGLISQARNQMGAQVSAPGPGNQANAKNQIIQAINLLKMAGLGLAPGDKLHTDVYNTINRLSRHLGGVAGMAPAAGVQKTMLGDQLRRTVQQQLMARLFGQNRGKQGPAGGPQPPMPSTPLPGA